MTSPGEVSETDQLKDGVNDVDHVLWVILDDVLQFGVDHHGSEMVYNQGEDSEVRESLQVAQQTS